MLTFQVVVATVGLIGNMLSVLVLSMEEMKNCFNCLLISLAMFDTVFIILATLDYSFAIGWKRNQLTSLIIYFDENIRLKCSLLYRRK